jgi:serine/threonine-protein kinase PknG
MSGEIRPGGPVACVRPDCPGDGVIDDDGFCDVCDRAPATARVTVPVTAPGTDHAAGGPCPRPDCRGGILDEDGFCGTCDRAAPRALPETRQAAPSIWHSVAWESPDRPDGGEPPALTFPPGIPTRPLGRAELGLGIVPIPALPARDPDSLLLKDPALEELMRRCQNQECQAEVGRGRGGEPGEPEGRCPVCSTTFSFRPPLRRGEILGQYEVRGCIGYGGQGWVYLASDLNLDGDPVAIKGLRDLASAASHAASAAERRTLIEVRHPDIVDIRNFVQHRDPVSNRVSGYIVLEFLDGESLAQKAQRSVLPVAEAIAYILAVLPALGYLHDSGLVYGDFKPANVMQVRDRLKLIDLGAVCRIGDPADHRSVVTRGFQAPEVAEGSRPSVSSDLYTVGRTLAVLTTVFDFVNETNLPGPQKVPVFSEYESFYRFLRRATAKEPRHRFVSAAQMAAQLVGVLREVIALRPRAGQRLPPMPSTLFTLERDALTTGPRSARDAALALPVPRPDDSDPAAAFLGTVTAADPAEVLAQLPGAPRVTTEVAFRLALARIGQPGGPESADAQSADAQAAGTGSAGTGSAGTGSAGSGAALEVPPDADPADWRFVWYRGLVELSRDRPEDAWRAFAAIRDLLPGEPAPKLALAVCAELLHAPALARHYYQTVWRTDEGFVGAAFGVARTYAAEPGDDATKDAIEVLESIPESLHHHVAARIEALRLRLGLGPGERGLREAARRLRDLKLGEQQSLRQKIGIWHASQDWLAKGGTPARPGQSLLDVELTPDALGFALEHAYLALRRQVPERRDRVDLAKRAHAARPRTRW